LKERHWNEVEMLLSIGVKNGESRAKIAALLPPSDKRITGRQSISFQGKNRQGQIDKTRNLLTYICSVLGTQPTMGKTPTSIISGTVDTPYPNGIKDFDAFMLENKVFSHAFTDLRMLRYTTGIELINK